jgi:5-methyltetrahydropteroyltriglutamate--homocysteine methyltransferase
MPGKTPLRSILREQASAGLDIVTDGQISWSDPIFHPMAQLEGVRAGEERRFLETPIFFRQPVVESKLRSRDSHVLREYREARASTELPVKAVLTGPYTLARSSVIATTAYPTGASLAAHLATLLAQQVHDLARAGAKLIQIDEPLILRSPDQIRLLRELLEPIYDAAGREAELAVTTYLGNTAALYAQLNSLPADIIGIDCSSSADLIDVVSAAGASKILAVGIVSGLTEAIEDAAASARVVERLLRRYAFDRLHLQPSCGMHTLPRSTAYAKLCALQRIRAQISNSSENTLRGAKLDP